MITVENYKSETKNIDFSKLPEALQKAHNNFDTMAQFYDTNDKIKGVLDAYLDKLNQALMCEGEPQKESKKKTKSKPKTEHKKASKPKAKSEKSESKKEKKTSSKSKKRKKPEAKQIEKVHEEIRFIKRYILLHEKVKTKKQILLFINALQKAITEKRISKKSKYADEIMHIQEQLVKLFNRMDNETRIELDNNIFEKYYKLAYSEKVMSEITIIKQYIGLHGKKDVKERAERLMVKITNAFVKGKIDEHSKYLKKIKAIKRSLEDYVMDKSKKVAIHSAELNGLMGIVGQTVQKKKPENNSLNGLTGSQIINMDFENMGFTGKWKTLFGDPEKVFHVMIWGGEGSGKSTFAINFAKYLAKDLHQKVAYVAGEQQYSSTLKSIIKRLKATPETLIYKENLERDYSDFDFVFNDSVTFLELSHNDLKHLQENNPQTCFIYVLQALKDGSGYYGERKIGHLVDIKVRVEREDKNTSVASIDDKNRFGGQGSIEVWFG